VARSIGWASLDEALARFLKAHPESGPPPDTRFGTPTAD